MKNRHIIAAALLLLTTTTAAQDRHTETTPDTGENLQTTANRSKRCNGSSTCSKRGGTPWP